MRREQLLPLTFELYTMIAYSDAYQNSRYGLQASDKVVFSLVKLYFRFDQIFE